MRLTINNEDVSYSLEQEKTLGEVVHGVRAWLATAGFVVTGLSADGRDLLGSGAEAWGPNTVNVIVPVGDDPFASVAVRALAAIPPVPVT